MSLGVIGRGLSHAGAGGRLGLYETARSCSPAAPPPRFTCVASVAQTFRSARAPVGRPEGLRYARRAIVNTSESRGQNPIVGVAGGERSGS